MNTYQERPRKGGGTECRITSHNEAPLMPAWRHLLPIAFTAENAQKVHDGTKTQTRRLLNQKLQLPTEGTLHLPSLYQKPRYRVGDVLWVQEPWRTHWFQDTRKPTELPDNAAIKYEGRPTHDILGSDAGKLRPGRFLPLRFARPHRYEVVSVRCERVNEISRDDVLAEGVELLPPSSPLMADTEARDRFRELWNSIHLEPSPIYERRDDGRLVIVGYKSFPWSNADFDAAHPGVRARGIYRKKPITVTENPWVFAYTFRKVK